MKTALNISRRYLFSPKSTHAINIISIIAMTGIAVGCAAFIIILSTFNGFEDLISKLYSCLNPEVKITAKQGKIIKPDSIWIQNLKSVDGVEAVSFTLEEIAVFEYDKAHAIGTIKGVDESFLKIADKVDTIMKEGKFRVLDNETPLAVMGSSIAGRLGVSFDSRLGSAGNAMSVYMAKRKTQSSGISLLNGEPFKHRLIVPEGYFSTIQDFGNYVYTDLIFVQELLGYTNGEVGAAEIKIKQGYTINTVRDNIRNKLGKDYNVLNRFEQDESFYKVTKMERWVGYAILTFAFIIVAFNIIGALSMLVMDKRRDIAILKSMGATDKLIRNIFLYIGVWFAIIGTAVGFLIGTGLILLQQTVGLIRLDNTENGSGFLVKYYPVSLRWTDFILIFITITLITILASWFPAVKASKMEQLVREE
jgi:lipoprotein-releasing system permease protein